MPVLPLVGSTSVVCTGGRVPGPLAGGVSARAAALHAGPWPPTGARWQLAAACVHCQGTPPPGPGLAAPPAHRPLLPPHLAGRNLALLLRILNHCQPNAVLQAQGTACGRRQCAPARNGAACRRRCRADRPPHGGCAPRREHGASSTQAPRTRRPTQAARQPAHTMHPASHHVGAPRERTRGGAPASPRAPTPNSGACLDRGAGLHRLQLGQDGGARAIRHLAQLQQRRVACLAGVVGSGLHAWAQLARQAAAGGSRCRRGGCAPAPHHPSPRSCAVVQAASGARGPG